jgi:hypothetical protein
VSIKQKDLQKAVLLLQQGNWKAAHEIVQKDEESPLACWAHGIVHILEGDLPNARYWYGEAKQEFPEPVSTESEISRLKAALGQAEA